MLSIAATTPLSFAAGAAGFSSAAVAPSAAGISMQAPFDVTAMPGVCAPFGFFDPLGFSADASEGKIKFYREAEIKHGRLAMVASVGILVGENFHPFTKNDLPAYIAFQESWLQGQIPLLLFLAAVQEIFSVFTFNSPFGGESWSIRSDYANGDFGFDPLNLKPASPAEFKEMQTKELNNGRLAMIAAAGMLGQELATGHKLF